MERMPGSWLRLGEKGRYLGHRPAQLSIVIDAPNATWKLQLYRGAPQGLGRPEVVRRKARRLLTESGDGTRLHAPGSGGLDVSLKTPES